tara:strand:- start:841 stop:1401 length:561 start_codon:yes stop_codon:yes gene_type:complete
MDKSILRKKYKELRDNISENKIIENSIGIANQSLLLPIWNYNYFHIFLSIENLKEVNTNFLLSILQGKDKEVVIPKIINKIEGLESYLLTDQTKLKLNSIGIPEPIEGIIIYPEKIDVVFIPLLAYDLKGNRVGYGKGFYDKFLKKCNNKCLKIGLSFFPPEKTINIKVTDVPLDFCVTPNKLYSF